MQKGSFALRRFFTLIEMLVVVAILASLLSPSLQKALRTARSLSCLNSLKQLGVWGTTYANDWNGVLPIQNEGGDGSYAFAKKWVDVLRDEGIRSDFATGAGLVCPALMTDHGAMARGAAYSCYGLNAAMGGAKVSGHPVPTIRLLSAKAFWFADGRLFARGTSSYDVHPRLTVNAWQFAADGCNDGDGPWCWVKPGLASAIDLFNPNGGHKGTMDVNCVYGDGHVGVVDYVNFFSKPQAERNLFLRGY